MSPTPLNTPSGSRSTRCSHGLFARMPDTAEYQQHPAQVIQRMQQVVRLLSEPVQPGAEGGWGRAELLQQISARLEDAAQTCVDQASLLFQQTETDVLMWHMFSHAGPSADDAQALLGSALGVLRQHLLDERIARLYDARVARRRALVTRGGPLNLRLCIPMTTWTTPVWGQPIS